MPVAGVVSVTTEQSSGGLDVSRLPGLPQLLALVADVDGTRGPNDEPLVQLGRPSMLLMPSTSPTQTAMYFTKLHALPGVDVEQVFSNVHVAVLSCYGVPNAAHLEAVRRECESQTMHFVGDLDPLDLSAFLVLAASLLESGKSVRYVGVSGKWVERCRRLLPVGKSMPLIPMSDFELRHWRALASLPISWPSLVGASAVAVLDSGMKLELEGATNPAFYSSAVSDEVSEDLRTAANCAS